ncbi:hypothetical protein OZX69_09700 (plasmid) [Lactobacillus sp. ESL0731]|uniref:hypothetical protein n=1 Tax=unclassified Lactobacillus TaxID=2620435 RepID=UPI0023F71004|nr:MULTISPECIES: hypothetical protein [unclassified Lactobacillus]WEV52083.1 hypothetical protein OZX63_09625 [Lactobacillus sp. ESL0700]WEV63226.1 hypothetical protein OZX69_09700 [Lactobacillus sp. ESL0731]
MKRIVILVLNLVFGFIDHVLTFVMFHSKICLLLFVCWVLALCLISKKAEETEIFGFWWRLNRRLDTLLNAGLKTLEFAFVIEMIGCFMVYLALYKGV